MRDLACEELEEAVQLGRVAPHRRRELGRIGLGRLHRAHVELQAVAEALDAPEHAYRISFAEASVEELDVRPDARLDPPARVDELECEVGRAASRPPPFFARDRVDPLHDAVFGKGGDRRHGPSLGLKPDARLGPRWPKSSRFGPFATASRPARSRRSSLLRTTSSRRSSGKSSGAAAPTTSCT